MSETSGVAPLSFSDMAVRLGHSADWWKRRAADRTVPHHRDGRKVWFTEDDVATYLELTAVAPQRVDPLRSQTSRSRAAQRRGAR